MSEKISRRAAMAALPIAAAGTALSVSVLALQSPRERIDHHLKELAAAFQELYPDREFTIRRQFEGGDEFSAGPDRNARPGMFSNWAPSHPLALIVG